jgi:hypothetical protein
MPTIGPGVREIRIHIAGAHRVFYVSTHAEAIYVLHAFEKKTRKTAARDLETSVANDSRHWGMRQHDGKEQSGEGDPIDRERLPRPGVLQ